MTNITHQSILETYIDRGLHLEKGEGAYLHDTNGKKYLDLMTNYGVNIFGYAHPVISEALSKQIYALPTLHGSFHNAMRTKATNMLVQACLLPGHKVYWSNSGAESMEAAIKFAVLATNKKKFISCKNGYHGKTLGALSATSSPKYKQPFSPLLWDFQEIDYNSIEALKSALDDKTAAFIVEPVQGEGGIISPHPTYLHEVARICKEREVLLIVDEIQTGVGRTGSFLASQRALITPDILCLGKGLAGGIPVGATLVSKQVALKIPKQMQTSTFGGNPLSAAGVVAVIGLLDAQKLDHIASMGAYFVSELSKIKNTHIGEVRGSGLMIGISLGDVRNTVLKRLQGTGILAIPAGQDVVRFLPPYVITKAEVDSTVATIARILETI